MKANRPRLSYANVVATLALVLALGGTSAFAAGQLAKNTVGPTQLKKNAVTGAKVKDGSLSGADIGGPVEGAQRATTADSATAAATAGRATTAVLADNASRAADADRLGGSLPGDFLPASGLQRVDFRPTGCSELGCVAQLWSVDGMAISAICAGGVPGSLTLGVSAAPSGSSVIISGTDEAGGQYLSELKATPESTLPLFIEGTNGGFGGELIFRSPAHTSTFVFAAFQSSGDCTVYGNVISS